MPETIRSWLFWLFMFLRMGSGEAEPGRSPTPLKNFLPSPPIVMPSLSEALKSYEVVVVTGGSSGIGSSFIRLGQKLNPDLVFCNLSRRSPERNTSPNLEKFLNHFPCDLSRSDEVERAAGAVLDFLGRAALKGRILLINNSGRGAFGPFPEPSLAGQLEMIDLNVRALVQLTGLLLPLLKARGGAVLNVASTVAFQPTPFAATYGASKAFVLDWTVALNEELRGSGVRALALCPGTTRTEFFRSAGLGRKLIGGEISMTADEVAECALRALASGRGLVVPGLVNKLYTFASARISKPLAARLAAVVLRGRRSVEGRT